jgi:ribonuclease G
VTVHPELLNRLRTEDEELLIDIERRYAGRLIFRSDASLHVEKFSIANAQTNEELTA